ncbi:MAG TPA: hypothetical protein VF331_22360 [Polyangiales bacterium]
MCRQAHARACRASAGPARATARGARSAAVCRRYARRDGGGRWRVAGGRRSQRRSADAFAAWRDTRWNKRGDDYEAYKKTLSDRLLELLFTQLPQLRGKVLHAELSTPLSTQHFTGHPKGAIYGLGHGPARFDGP